MIVFWLVAALFVAGALLMLLPPLWKGGSRVGVDTGAASLAVHREAWASLQAEVEAGVLGAEQLAAAQRELEQRALDDSRRAAAPALAPTAAPPLLLACCCPPPRRCCTCSWAVPRRWCRSRWPQHRRPAVRATRCRASRSSSAWLRWPSGCASSLRMPKDG